HGYHSAIVAIHDRYRRTPEALARNAPIANAVGDGAATKTVRGGVIGHLTYCALRKLPAPFATVDQHPVLDERLFHVHRLVAARSDIDSFALLSVNDRCNHLTN